MHDTEDRRPRHLGWIETKLRSENPDLATLRLLAQSHYGPLDRVAYIEVHGVCDDRERRRRIRREAGDWLVRLGYDIALEPGRDVHEVCPVRPASAHEAMQFLRNLRDLTA
jgi:hypothetical protein